MKNYKDLIIKHNLNKVYEKIKSVSARKPRIAVWANLCHSMPQLYNVTMEIGRKNEKL